MAQRPPAFPLRVEPHTSSRKRSPRIGAELVDYLERTFPPRCIKPGESEIEAHRYAAKVELAETLIRMAKQEEHPDFSYQED